MIYLNIFLIAVIFTYGLDVAQFWNEITSIITRWMTDGVVEKPLNLKPFSCSLCMTFWTGLIYALCVGQFSLVILAWICFCSWLTTVIPAFFFFIEAFITKVFSELGEWFHLE